MGTIIISIKNGEVVGIECPPDMNVYIRDYDLSHIFHSEYAKGNKSIEYRQNIKVDDNQEEYIEVIWGQ